MQLCDISVGDIVVVKTLDFPPLLSKRLRDLGFGEEDRVECVRHALLSSPILYYTKGSFVALRKSDAMRVGVAYEQ